MYIIFIWLCNTVILDVQEMISIYLNNSEAVYIVEMIFLCTMKYFMIAC